MLSTRKQNWGEDRVMFYDYDAEGRLHSLLASWADVACWTSPRSSASGRWPPIFRASGTTSAQVLSNASACSV
ncbi:Y4bD/Y4pK family protein [Mesorhizobium sp. M0933]|uniref:hypothetical protein n=1 Tax=Mesorhizobium sp. M0933 TaxID=2957030 RepID=UPI003339178A